MHDEVGVEVVHGAEYLEHDVLDVLIFELNTLIPDESGELMRAVLQRQEDDLLNVENIMQGDHVRVTRLLQDLDFPQSSERYAISVLQVKSE